MEHKKVLFYKSFRVFSRRYSFAQKPTFRDYFVSNLQSLETLMMGHPSSPETLLSEQKMTSGKNPKTFIQQDNRGESLQSHTNVLPCNDIYFFSVLSFLSFVLSFSSILYLYILCSHVTYSSTTQTSMLPAEFEFATPASEQHQTARPLK